MTTVDVGRVLVLRELLASSGWVERTQNFARTMRRSTKDPGGLLLVGTPDVEPWHLAAHLDDEARISGVPELSPTLIRYAPPADAPAHLSVTLQRLEQAKRGETVFVVSEENAPSSLLERAWDARKTGATVLALDSGDNELQQVAHESLTVVRSQIETIRYDVSQLVESPVSTEQQPAESGDVVTFDTVQHLVSVAAGEAASSPSNRTMRQRLAHLLESISGPLIDSGG
jgi:hypothetical protein